MFILLIVGGRAMFDFRRPIAAVLAGLATTTVVIVIHFIFEHASGRGWT
jgi:hypothetical protein